jgi:nucleoid-associated protein YgaU
MPPKNPHQLRTRSRLRDLPRALGGLVVLLALLTALPAALLVATQRYAAPGLADFSSISQILTRQDNGAAFLLVLVVIGWIGFASFAVSVLLEIPAQLRGRAAPHIRGLVWSQQIASTLVSAILLLLPTAGAALAATAHPASAATLRASTVATSSAVAGYTVSASSTQAPSTQHPTYTVLNTSPAQSLWSIAQDQLGAGERWHEIADLNQGRTMADGLVFHSDQPIQPGWVLLMPGTAAAGTASPGDAGTITVHHGDTLSSLAQEHLGSADKYLQLFDANRDRPEPNGEHLTDPDHIEPGWTLTLPASGTTTAPSTGTTPAPTTGQNGDGHTTAPAGPPAASPCPPANPQVWSGSCAPRPTPPA